MCVNIFNVFTNMFNVFFCFRDAREEEERSSVRFVFLIVFLGAPWEEEERSRAGFVFLVFFVAAPFFVCLYNMCVCLDACMCVFLFLKTKSKQALVQGYNRLKMCANKSVLREREREREDQHLAQR